MRVSTDLISIVVPSFRQANWLGSCLDSIFNQEDPHLEVILIDGGSVDGTQEIIRKYSHRLAYAVSEKDSGQSHALNKGFARVQGKWLGWLNSDDLLLPGAINALRRAIEQEPEGEWFAGGGWFIDEQDRRVKHYAPPSRRLSAIDLSPWTNNWFAQPGSFFSRALFEKAGPFLREDLRYAMDLDLWLRMGKLSPLYPLNHDTGAYRLHKASKTVAERPEMEVDVVRVLIENLGLQAGLARVHGLAEEKFETEFRYRRLAKDLLSPAGWLRLVRRRMGGMSD